MVAIMGAARAGHVSPEDVAQDIVASHGEEPEWLDRFSAALDARRRVGQLQRVMEVWGLSGAEAARVLKVSRQALAKWSVEGIPAARSTAVADLAAAADLLSHYLRRDRIPAVVRRPVADEAGRSLLELASEDPARALDACRAMFDFAAIAR